MRYFQSSQSTTFNTDMNIPANSHYRIDGVDVLHDYSISSVKSFVLNARMKNPTEFEQFKRWIIYKLYDYSISN